MSTIDDIALIDRYINGELTPDELRQFEERVNSDEEFASELQFIQDMKIGIREAKRKELKGKLEKIAEEHHGGSSASTRSIRPYLAIAATITLLITIGGLAYYIGFRDSKDSQLAQEESFSIQDYLSTSEKEVEFESYQKQLLGEPVFGFASSDTVRQTVAIIQNKEYNSYYFKSDTLYIFGELEKGKIRIYSYNSLEGEFMVIHHDDQIYKIGIIDSDSITPLVFTDDRELLKAISKQQ